MWITGCTWCACKPPVPRKPACRLDLPGCGSDDTQRIEIAAFIRCAAVFRRRIAARAGFDRSTGSGGGVIRRQSWLIPAQDRITLMRTRVFRPPGAGPFPLAVIAHGSTQNEIRRAEFRAPQYPALTEWLVARGYAVAVPQRPGHGETGGPYHEAQGGCANADFAQGRAGCGVEHRGGDRFSLAAGVREKVRRSGARSFGRRLGCAGADDARVAAARGRRRVRGRGSAAVSTMSRERTARRIVSSPRREPMARRRACRRFGSTPKTTVIFRPRCRSAWPTRSARAAGAAHTSCCPRRDRTGTN